VLVADELGPLPETIHSRCQLVPFGRLSEGAVRTWLAERAPDLSEQTTLALARVAGGRLDRAARLLDEDAGRRRDALIDAARGAYLDPEFEPADAAEALTAGAAERGAAAKDVEQQALEGRDLPAREAEQRLRRVQRGAERDELLASLEELAAWYRDLLVVVAGADAAVLHADRLEDLRADAARGLGEGPERAAALCRHAWRAAEEFNVNASLALEALFVQLQRAFE
jgi:DNA polymerase-3 subunit delta'